MAQKNEKLTNKSTEKTDRNKQPQEYLSEEDWVKKQDSKIKPQINVSQFEEITLDDVADTLSYTIINNVTNKKIVFLGMLSAYTDSSQINVSMNAPSSQGKTHIIKEVAGLFPEEEKIGIHGATPTSFFYEIDYIDKERNIRYKDVRRMIIIFYELPDPSLQIKLRPLLSHDGREIIHKQTNKSKGRNVTDTTIVRGYAAFMFCSANMKLDEQEATRAILLSPEVNHETLSKSLQLIARRNADVTKFNDWLESRPDRIALKNRIIAIREEHIDEVVINNPEAIEKRFVKLAGKLISRHQRDMAHLFELIRATALLNVWFRRQPDGSVLANQTDIDEAFDLFSELFESQNLNIPPTVFSFYKQYIVPAYIKLREKNVGDYQKQSDFNNDKIGLTNHDLNAYYLSVENTSLNSDTLRKNILPPMESAGLIIWEKPTSEFADKRSAHIFPKKFTKDEQKQLNNIGRGGENNIDSNGEAPPVNLDLFR